MSPMAAYEVAELGTSPPRKSTPKRATANVASPRLPRCSCLARGHLRLAYAALPAADSAPAPSRGLDRPFRPEPAPGLHKLAGRTD